MSIQKFTTALLLSVSLIYFCAADCMISKPQIISSNSMERSLTGAAKSDNPQSQRHEYPEVNQSANGVTLILDNIKKEVSSHYTGALPQNWPVYRRA